MKRALGFFAVFALAGYALAQSLPLISPVPGNQNDGGLQSAAVVISQGTSVDFVGGTGVVALYSLNGTTLASDAGVNFAQGGAFYPQPTTCTAVSATTCTHAANANTTKCICTSQSHAYATGCAIATGTATCTSGTSSSDVFTIWMF
jgi:hypothetical protein